VWKGKKGITLHKVDHSFYPNEIIPPTLRSPSPNTTTPTLFFFFLLKKRKKWGVLLVGGWGFRVVREEELV